MSPVAEELIFIDPEGKVLASEFWSRSGVAYCPKLAIQSQKILAHLQKQTEKLESQQVLSLEQLWLGSLYREEIQSGRMPHVFLRFINPTCGWGVFAGRFFRRGEFIAEYSGLLRRKKRQDRKNSYCFEYLIAPGYPTPYVIDAREQGGISRYINHSASPNLRSALATVEKISHVLLLAQRDIQPGEQLCYHYGEDYWTCRPRPMYV